MIWKSCSTARINPTKKRGVRRRDNAHRLKKRDFIFLAVFAAFAAVVATQWIAAEYLNYEPTNSTSI